MTVAAFESPAQAAARKAKIKRQQPKTKGLDSSIDSAFEAAKDALVALKEAQARELELEQMQRENVSRLFTGKSAKDN